MNDNKVKVLYIAGWGRSGSTILETALGQVEGLFAVGELNRIWDHGLRDNGLCSCGFRVKECPVWANILEEAFGSLEQDQLESMIAYRDEISRTRNFPIWILSSGKRLNFSLDTDFMRMLSNLYQAIQKVTNCDVIIDSSKFPIYGKVLGLLPSLQVNVLHLIRDPRAVAFSWKRKKVIPDSQRLFRHRSAMQSSIFWLVWNKGTELLWRDTKDRYMRVLYEEFVSQPVQVVSNIVQYLKLAEYLPVVPFQSDGELDIRDNHSICGNPVRFQKGPIKLEGDYEWLSQLRPRDRFLVTMMTLPLLKRYGYQI
jgi:hypothetical protein